MERQGPGRLLDQAAAILHPGRLVQTPANHRLLEPGKCHVVVKSHRWNARNLLRNSAFLPAVVYKRNVATASAAADDSTTLGPGVAPAEGGVTAVGAPVAHRRRAAADVFATEFEEMRDNIPRKASELFFPADEMKALGFIVLDWSPKAADHQQQQPQPQQQQLDPKSKQAQLLKKIGLLDKPNLLSLVQLASSYPYDGACACAVVRACACGHACGGCVRC